MRALLPLLLLALLPSVSAQQEEGTMLHMIEYSYIPEPLEVPPGATIIAMNFGPQDQSRPREEWAEYVHSVTAVDGSFDVQQIQPDFSAHPFTAPTTEGTYRYYCRYHGDAQGNGMAGTLIVREGAPTGATTTSPQPQPTTVASPDADGRGMPMPALAALGGLAVAAAWARRRA